MTVPFKKLKICKQHRGAGKNVPLRIIGADTETDPKENKCLLLALECGEFVNPNSFHDIIDLFFQKKFRGASFVFWNLQFDVQSFLKWIPPEFWATLWEQGKVELEPGVFLSLIPWKYFSIRDRNKKRAVKMYDVCQFYNYISLDRAARDYLDGEKKLDFDRVNISDFSAPETVAYCVQDAKLAGDLARKLVDIHAVHFPGSPVSLLSKASMSEKHFLSRVRVPTVNSLIGHYDKFLFYGYSAYKGGFFEVFKKGHFPHVFCYDLNSAYPYEIARLPNLRWGRFCFLRGKPPRDAVRGYMRVRVNLDPAKDAVYFSPVSLDVKGLRFYPGGSFKTFLTMAEYETYRDYFDVDIIDGVYWIPDRDLDFLFREEIERLYQWKAGEKDPVLKSLIKIVLNSFYGKMIQKIPDHDTGLFKTGNCFNPFWAADITAGTRVSVFRALLRSGRGRAVMVATDSLTVTKPLDLDVGPGLGQWSLEKAGEAVIIGTGVYSIRANEKTQTRLRGFKPTGRIDFIDLDSIEGISTEIKIQIRKHVSLAESLIQKKPAEMNLIKTDFRGMDLNFDYRRFWLDKFTSISDIKRKTIDSIPLMAEMLC